MTDEQPHDHAWPDGPEPVICDQCGSGFQRVTRPDGAVVIETWKTEGKLKDRRSIAVIVALGSANNEQEVLDT